MAALPSPASPSHDRAPDECALPMRVMLYLRAGGLVMHWHADDDDDDAGVVASPLKLHRLGFLLVSLREHMGGAPSHTNTKTQRMRMMQHEIVAVHGEQCVAVAMVATAAMQRRAADRAAAVGVPSLQRAATAAALAADQHALQLQLRQLVHCCEVAFGSSLLPALNQRHQRLIDEMISSDDIHKQMQDGQHSDGAAHEPDPLHNTHTIPQLAALEQFVGQLMRRGDLRQRWYGDLFAFGPSPQLPLGMATAPLPTSSRLLAAHLISTGDAASASAASIAHILLSYTVPHWAALNLAGPTNEGLWSVVIEFARALCARHQSDANVDVAAASAASSCVAVSFPLSSPPLLVYLCPVAAPVVSAGCCLIVVEMGPTAVPTSPSRYRSGALPPAPSELQWIDPALLVAPAPAPALAPVSLLSAPLLPADHPLSLEQARHPRPFVLLDSEASLPAWHSSRVSLQRAPAQAQDAASQLSVWGRVCCTARTIEAECALPDPQSLMMPDAAPAASSPMSSVGANPTGDAVTATATVSTSPESEPEPEPSLVSPVSLLASGDTSSPAAACSPAASDDTSLRSLDAPFVALLPIEPSPSPLSAQPSPAASASLATSAEDLSGVQVPLHDVEPAELLATKLSREEEEEEKSNGTDAAAATADAAAAPPSEPAEPFAPHAAPVFRPTPPSAPAPSAPLEFGGTASFRRRKIQAAPATATAADAPVSAWKSQPPPPPPQPPVAPLHPHPVPPVQSAGKEQRQVSEADEPLPAHLAPSLPLAPVVARAASSGKQKLASATPLPLPPAHPSVPILARVPSIPVSSAWAPSSGAHATVELSMDTPRLETTQVQVTPRVPLPRRASDSAGTLFPPLVQDPNHQDQQQHDSALAKLQTLSHHTDDEAF